MSEEVEKTLSQRYPKWKYNSSGEGVVVQSPEEEETLGSSWLDHPSQHLPKKSTQSESSDEQIEEETEQEDESSEEDQSESEESEEVPTRRRSRRSR